MKRAFVITILFWGLLSTGSSQVGSSQNSESKEDYSKIRLSLNMDSILLEYCCLGNKFSKYYISLSNNDKVVIKSGNYALHKYPSIIYTVDSLDLVKSFVTCINKFYIDKTEKIILERKKTNLMIESEYPLFFITGYRKGKKVVNESTIFSDNELFIFNPLFIEFHELTRKLVKFVDDELELRK